MVVVVLVTVVVDIVGVTDVTDMTGGSEGGLGRISVAGAPTAAILGLLDNWYSNVCRRAVSFK